MRGSVASHLTIEPAEDSRNAFGSQHAGPSLRIKRFARTVGVLAGVQWVVSQYCRAARWQLFVLEVFRVVGRHIVTIQASATAARQIPKFRISTNN